MTARRVDLDMRVHCPLFGHAESSDGGAVDVCQTGKSLVKD